MKSVFEQYYTMVQVKEKYLFAGVFSERCAMPSMLKVKKKKKKFNHKVSNTLNGVPNLFTFKMCFRMRQNIQQKNAGWHLIGL